MQFPKLDLGLLVDGAACGMELHAALPRKHGLNVRQTTRARASVSQSTDPGDAE